MKVKTRYNNVSQTGVNKAASANSFKFLMTFLLCVFLLLSHSIYAQNDGAVDMTFNPYDGGFGAGVGLNNSTNAIVIQDDGKIIISGSFTQYNGVNAFRITRLNTDGNLDYSFNPGAGANGTITSLALQSDGKIFIGGNFTQYNGTNINRIARLNSDGTLDATFNPGGSGVNGLVNALVVQSDGKVLAAGDFTTYNGGTKNRLVRLKTDGIVDDTFNIGAGISGGWIKSMALQNDGKILLGGNFTMVSGVATSCIVRLNSDGVRDGSFNIGAGATSEVRAIAIQSDGKIILAGSLFSYNNTSVNRMVRVDINGTLDNTFTAEDNGSATINSVKIQDDGKILVAGAFLKYGTTTVGRVVRLNTNGTIDATFNPSGIGADGPVDVMATQNNGNILLGGRMTKYNGKTSKYLVNVTASGAFNTAFNPVSGPNGMILSAAVQSDKKVLIGGSFSDFFDNATNKIARLNADGTLDAGFSSGTGFSFGSDVVNAIAIQTDGKIVAGGGFNTYNDNTASQIVRLLPDGTIDNLFNPGGSGFNLPVRDLAIQSDGKIIVVGGFNLFNGIAANRIARLKPDGTLDTDFNTGSGLISEAYAIAIQNDGKILVGSSSTSYNNTMINRLVRLEPDGEIDPTFNIGTGFSSSITALAIQPDGKVIVGGNYSTFQGNPAGAIVRLNADGSLDTDFVTGTGFTGYTSGASTSTVLDLHVQNDGKILVAGSFTGYNGAAATNIIRLNADGTIDQTFNSGSGSNATIQAMARQDDDKVIIGGNFTEYDSAGRNFITRITSSSSISAPTNFASSPGNGSVTLSWDAVNTATSYNLYRGTTSGSLTLLKSGETSTSYSDNSVINGTTYYYAVTAVDASSAESPQSIEEEATPDGTVPVVALTTTVTATNQTGFDITMAFSEYIAGANIDDSKFSIINGTVTNFATGADPKTFIITITPSAEGPVTMQALAGMVKDDAGNTSEASNTLIVTYDTQAPAAPTAPVFAGISGQFTNNTTPTVSGISEAGSSIQIYVNGQPYSAPVTADADGKWSYTFPVLAEDTYLVSLLETDAAGNSSASGASTILTIDTKKPNQPGIVANGQNGQISSNPQVSLSGTGEVNSIVTIYANGAVLDAVIVDANGIWEYTSDTLADNTYTLTVTLTDAAGNISQSSDAINLSIDATPPVVAGVNNNGEVPSGKSITFNEGSATLNGQPYTSGTAIGEAGSYTLIVTDAANNQTTIHFTVTKKINSAPTLAAIANTAICYTPATQSIALSGITAGTETDQTTTLSVGTDNASLFDILEVIRNGSTGTLSYKLKENASGTATITLTVHDDGGTENGGQDTFSQSFVLNVNPLPIAEIITSSTSISKGETIILTATGGTSYRWSTGETTSSIAIRPEQSSIYQVSVSSGSCSSLASVSIEVKSDYVALSGTNIVSPNGDGVNDNFIIKNIDMYPNNTVQIYDRAGRLLYSKANYKDEWNGTFDGSPLDEGTYFYVVDFGNVAGPIKGYITIVRD